MNLNKDLNVGFVGCGDIANYHADVLSHIGVRIKSVAVRTQSDRLNLFKKKYNIESVYFSWKEMLENENLDAIWVLASWDEIDNILSPILEYKIPLFFEKPVALSANSIENVILDNEDMIGRVQIGYNRRFYDYIPEIKKMISQVTINAAEIVIPENTSHIKDPNLLKRLFLQSSSHVMDLLIYLLDADDISVKEMVRNGSQEKPSGYNGMLLIDKKIPVHLSANWNSPANFALKLFSNDYLIEFLPLEKVTIFKEIEIIPPSKGNPITSYKPKKNKTFQLSQEGLEFKPGFLNQAKNFIETCVLREAENTIAADLHSALKLTKVCERIMFGEFNSSNAGSPEPL